MKPATAIFVILALMPGWCVTIQAICEGEDYRQFDSLLGNWEEYELSDEGRVHLGTLATELVACGCALKQTFFSPDKSFSFESFGYLEADEAWTEHYVLSTGRIVSYKWSRRGETLVLERISRDSGKMKRLVIFDIKADSYFVSDEESVDDGGTWTRRELVHTIRQGAAQP